MIYDRTGVVGAAASGTEKGGTKIHPGSRVLIRGLEEKGSNA